MGERFSGAKCSFAIILRLTGFGEYGGVMKTFVLTVLFVAAGLALAPSNAVSTSIRINPPVMLDTSAVYQATGSLGSFCSASNLLSAIGDSGFFYCAQTEADGVSIMYARTSFNGDLLDTTPHWLLGGTDYPIGFKFAPTSVQWSAPYYYVVGDYQSSISAISQFAYMRVTAGGEVVDQLPTIFASSSPSNELGKAGSSFWSAYQLNFYQAMVAVVSLYDLRSGTMIMDHRSFPIPGTTMFGTVPTDSGLYVSGYSLDSLFIQNRFIHLDGSVTLLDSVPTTPRLSWSMKFSGLRLGGDSVLYYAVDSSWQGSLTLAYYILSQHTASQGISLNTIPLPPSTGRDYNRKTVASVQSNILYLVLADYFTGVARLARADIVNGALLDCAQFRDSSKASNAIVSFAVRSSTAYLTFLRASDAVQLRFTPGYPISNKDSTLLLMVADQRCSPTLLVDSLGVLIHCQVASSNGVRLKSFRIADISHPQGAESYEYLTGQHPFGPVIRKVVGRRLLFWAEDTTHAMESGHPDTVFSQRFVFFDGDYPKPGDIAQAQEYYRIARNLPPKPSCLQVGSRIFFTHLGGDVFDGWEILPLTRMRRIDLPSGLLYSSAGMWISGGRTELVPYESTFAWMGSHYWCSNHSNIHCFMHDGYWTTYYSVGDSLQYGPSASMGGNDIYRGDVSAFPWGNRYAVLRQSATCDLISYNPNDGAVTHVANVATPDYYSKAYAVPTGEGICVVAVGGTPTRLWISFFDSKWNLLEQANVPLVGNVREFSEFALVPGTDDIAFAYSTYVRGEYGASRVYFQTIHVDVVTGVDDHGADNVPRFALGQNYPNPFNGETRIRFSLTSRSDVSMDIFNILGQKVWTQHLDAVAAGEHQVVWNGKSMSGREAASGVYFYRLTAGSMVATKKMLLLK
jgi:hypothetical protein